LLTISLEWPGPLSAQVIHFLLAFIAAFGLFRFWAKTRFWLPRYVHYLALAALLVSIWVFSNTSPDAPINQGTWRGVKGALGILALPATVYFFFVFYGGQREAHNRTHPRGPCRNCGTEAVPDIPYPNCGQMPT
jgi:hypothetical protein